LQGRLNTASEVVFMKDGSKARVELRTFGDRLRPEDGGYNKNGATHQRDLPDPAHSHALSLGKVRFLVELAQAEQKKSTERAALQRNESQTSSFQHVDFESKE